MDPQIQEPVFLIEADKIKPNPYQPRRIFDNESLRELAMSIRECGILQPLVVTKIEKDTESGTEIEYQLIAGERRLMAAKSVGLERVPAIIKRVNSERERLELAMIENIHRANLNPIELAKAYARLQEEFGLTQREVATRLGKSREAITNCIRLLGLSTPIQEALAQNKINESQARLFLAITDPKAQQSLFEETLRNNLSVRDLKRKITAAKSDPAQEQTMPIMQDPELGLIKMQLEERLGSKVDVEKIGESGKITIKFYSNEELKSIISKLSKNIEAMRDTISENAAAIAPDNAWTAQITTQANDANNAANEPNDASNPGNLHL